jgi:hypothetical protein
MGPYNSNVRRDGNQRAINRGDYNVSCGEDRHRFSRTMVPICSWSSRRLPARTEMRIGAPDHPLYSVRLHPLGHSGASDDAIFEAEDDRIFQVHLTLSGKTEKTPLPRFRAYVNTAEWIQTVMLPANEDYRG